MQPSQGSGSVTACELERNASGRNTVFGRVVGTGPEGGSAGRRHVRTLRVRHAAAASVRAARRFRMVGPPARPTAQHRGGEGGRKRKGACFAAGRRRGAGTRASAGVLDVLPLVGTSAPHPFLHRLLPRSLGRLCSVATGRRVPASVSCRFSGMPLLVPVP